MATIIVSSNSDVSADDGQITLREAVELANQAPGDDRIIFDDMAFGSDTTIRLTEGEIEITGGLEIDASGANGKITVSGDRNGDDTLIPNTSITDVQNTDGTQVDDNSRVFLVRSNYNDYSHYIRTEDVTFRDLTITGGYAKGGNGGGVAGVGSDPYAASITVIDSVITGNVAAGEGGGAYADYITISNSVVSGNKTLEAGGNGGGVSGSQVNIQSSEISGNVTMGSNASGGGVFGYLVEIYNSTIAENIVFGDGSRGGGVAGQRNIGLSSVTITGNSTRGEQGSGGGVASFYGSNFRNSIILGNYSAFTNSNDAVLNIPSYGRGNIIGPNDLRDLNVFIVAEARDVFAEIVRNGPVEAGALSNNGGHTQTVALSADRSNPALDVVLNPFFGEYGDQRGQFRNIDLAGVNNGGLSDIGAFELQPFEDDQPRSVVKLGTSRSEELFGSQKADFIGGQEGDDTLRGGIGRDSIQGNDGNDLLIGGKGGDSLNGGEGDDSLKGGRGADSLRGESGDNWLGGRRGNDLLSAENGNDTLLGGKGADRLLSGSGDDLLRGGRGQDVLRAGIGDDEVRGGLGNDSLSGGRGDDSLFGGSGRDQIFGGIGNDTLNGGRGRDSFIFLDGEQSDLIVDFTDGEDQIAFWLEGADFLDLELHQDGDSTIVRLGGIEIALASFNVADLDETDFMF